MRKIILKPSQNAGPTGKIYCFWNNKGGTGKTSLAFQAIARYAELHPMERILAVDICPQANLSELFFGGLVGTGGAKLLERHKQTPRASIGGYFQERLPNPYSKPKLSYLQYLSQPSAFNSTIPDNIMLLAGDPMLELQANAMATLANTQIPGTNTWLAILDWLKDYISLTDGAFDTIFIDTNPSFSIYTQIAISTANRLVLPVMADDSSRRAIQNAISLVYGLHMPSAIYSQHSFTSRLNGAGRTLPKIHVVAKNRITQYMGSASAYASVFATIDAELNSLIGSNPNIFSSSNLEDMEVEIRDFQTTGVVAFAEGIPFHKMVAGRHSIMNRRTDVKDEYLTNSKDALDALVAKL